MEDRPAVSLLRAHPRLISPRGPDVFVGATCVSLAVFSSKRSAQQKRGIPEREARDRVHEQTSAVGRSWPQCSMPGYLTVPGSLLWQRTFACLVVVASHIGAVFASLGGLLAWLCVRCSLSSRLGLGLAWGAAPGLWGRSFAPKGDVTHVTARELAISVTHVVK